MKDVLVSLNLDGNPITHIHGVLGDDVTLCGIASEAFSSLEARSGRKVNCPNCIAVWIRCREVGPTQIAPPETL